MVGSHLTHLGMHDLIRVPVPLTISLQRRFPPHAFLLPTVLWRHVYENLANASVHPGILTLDGIMRQILRIQPFLVH